MAFEEITALLRGWEGFELVGVRREAGPQIVLRLQRLPRAVTRCSGCGALVGEIHETTERRVRGLPILDATTWLIVPGRASHVRAAGRRSRSCRGSIGMRA